MIEWKQGLTFNDDDKYWTIMSVLIKRFYVTMIVIYYPGPGETQECTVDIRLVNSVQLLLIDKDGVTISNTQFINYSLFNNNGSFAWVRPS